MLLKIDQIDHLLLVAMATRLYFLCTAAMFVWTVEPEERSHAYKTSNDDTHTAALGEGGREGGREGEREGGRERGREGGREGRRREKGQEGGREGEREGEGKGEIK